MAKGYAPGVRCVGQGTAMYNHTSNGKPVKAKKTTKKKVKKGGY